eukprot:6002133-Alexandrium_andersonii.AAC.1
MVPHTASVRQLCRASDLVDRGTKHLLGKAAANYQALLPTVRNAVGAPDAFCALVRGEMRLGRLGREPFAECELPDEAAWASPG